MSQTVPTAQFASSIVVRLTDQFMHLSKAEGPLRAAQPSMRHSDPSLTANVYTDPKLLDVAGAVAAR